MNAFLQDFKYGLRTLRGKPLFTVVAVLTLALGIGGNVAMFSIVNAVLLRPLPFHDPSRLTLMHEGAPMLGFAKIGFSAPDLTFYQQNQRSFDGMAPFENRSFELSGAGEPRRIIAARVGWNLFPLLGVRPLLGRSFRREEDRPGVAVAMLSYGLWQSAFGASRDVVGRTVTLDRVPYTIIGVMPREFEFPLRGPSLNSDPGDLWVPIAYTQDELDGWGSMFNSGVVARLKPQVTLAQARAEAAEMANRIYQVYPAELKKAFGNARLVAQVDLMQAEISGGVRPLLLILQGAVALVLLIACTNVALLLLARASGRSREVAIRAAMGASRSRLISQLLTESFLLAVVGGILGLGLAVWSKDLLLKQVPAGIVLPTDVPLDSSVLVFTLLTTFLTAIFFGLAPALHATRGGLRGGVQEGGRSGTGSKARHRVQNAFVVVEFGLALLLLVGAGLLLRSFGKLLEVDPGFQAERVLAMTVALPKQAYSKANDVRNYYQQAILQLSQVPGIVSAAASNDLPLNGNELDAVRVEGDDQKAPAARQTWVLGDYLKTMGIPLLRGRLFTSEDRQGGQPVIIVSQSMARGLWPNQDPIGKRVQRGGLDEPWRTVIGVVGDVPDGPISAQALPHCYTPYLQESDEFTADNVGAGLRTLRLAVRTRGNPASLANAVVEELHRIDPALAVSNLRTMRTEVKQSMAPQRFNAILVAIYASVALLLALLGIYGVLAYMVMQQTQEIGIRIALGAHRNDILKLVIRRGMRLVVIGTAAGLAGALGITRLMGSLLYGIAPRDPLTFAGVTAVLIMTAVLACFIPALRAAKVDPIVALRYE